MAGGNATTVGAQAFTYDVTNQPTTGGGASYVYDANLRRVKSVDFLERVFRRTAAHFAGKRSGAARRATSPIRN